jgi:hypothetical protein
MPCSTHALSLNLSIPEGKHVLDHILKVQGCPRFRALQLKFNLCMILLLQVLLRQNQNPLRTCAVHRRLDSERGTEIRLF